MTDGSPNRQMVESDLYLYGEHCVIIHGHEKFVNLMVHNGATIDDLYGMLNGDGIDARFARFQDLEDIETKKPSLGAVIGAWIQIRDSDK